MIQFWLTIFKRKFISGLLDSFLTPRGTPEEMFSVILWKTLGLDVVTGMLALPRVFVWHAESSPLRSLLQQDISLLFKLIFFNFVTID